MKCRLNFALGFVLGAAIFGGSAAIAAGTMAQPKTAAVVIDGAEADLRGYVIEGAHYFQIRDLDAALVPGGKDFSVVWDGQGNAIRIDTSRGYDPNETMPQGAAGADTQTVTIEEMKAELIRLTNVERRNAGLAELEALPELMDCAQAKAQDFLDNHYYGHKSPVYGASYEMIRRFVPDASGAGENLAGCMSTAEEAFEGWRCSKEHSAILLERRFTHIGIGIVEGAGGSLWLVQHFAELL